VKPAGKPGQSQTFVSPGRHIQPEAVFHRDRREGTDCAFFHSRLARLSEKTRGRIIPTGDSATGEQIALEAFAVSMNRVAAPQGKSDSASRWLMIPLIVWLAGAAFGIASLPRHEERPEGEARPPAHLPADMESPTAHDLPAVA
jgi:hypothetical protein